MTTIRQENHHIFLSNKENCKKILGKNSRTRNDIIDFLISLHLVLETGLNAFFRQIILMQLQKGIEQTQIASNLDKISFIDKVTLFFYLPHFNFGDSINKADEYHSAIGKLRDFAGIRNKLLHGHMDGRVTYGKEHTVKTKTYELISEEMLSKQIETFKFVMAAVNFYFELLESSFTPLGKKKIKDFYLDVGFLGE